MRVSEKIELQRAVTDLLGAVLSVLAKLHDSSELSAAAIATSLAGPLEAAQKAISPPTHSGVSAPVADGFIAENDIPPALADRSRRSIEERIAYLQACCFTSPALICLRSRNRNGPHEVYVNGLSIRLPERIFLVTLVMLKLAECHNGSFFSSAAIVHAVEQVKELAARAKIDLHCLPNMTSDDLHKVLSWLRLKVKEAGGPDQIIQHSDRGYRMQVIPGDLDVSADWLTCVSGFEEVFMRLQGSRPSTGVARH